jgi:uncharacterized protein
MEEGPMTSSAFERYRQASAARSSLPWLLAGSLIVAICWLLATGAVIYGGAYLYAYVGPIFGPEPLTFDQGGFTSRFLASPIGVISTLLTFAGVWLGVWVAMRFLHREPVSRLFGAGLRLSRPGFVNGLIAVLFTSALTEIGFYLLAPEIHRGSVSLGVWFVVFVPVVLLAFIQTSSEEILFRGYLLRGLAARFRSPLVWAVLPTLLFTLLHWNAGSRPAMNIGVLVSIGGFAALLVALVYATGNLGAAMGAHLGNNLIGFLFISHENALSPFALYRGATLAELPWTAGQAVAIVGMSIVSILITLALLLHPRSPLKVGPDTAPSGDRVAASAPQS